MINARNVAGQELKLANGRIGIGHATLQLDRQRMGKKLLGVCLGNTARAAYRDDDAVLGLRGRETSTRANA